MGEFRYAFRILLKSPLTSVCAVLSLALGIGANTALFTVVNAILFKPLPGGVVNVYVSYPDGSRYGAGTWDEYDQYRKRSQSFAQLVAWNADPAQITIDSKVERMRGTAVSTNYFSTIGVQPSPGRGFLPGDENQRVAVISRELWEQRFHASVDVVGRSIQINDQAYMVIGVAPAAFWGLEAEGSHVFYSGRTEQAHMTGKLLAGVRMEQAQAEMGRLAAEIEQVPRKGATITITPGSLVTPRDAEQITSIVSLIFAALALVLIIACANVANLMLSRAAARRREIGVRVALGAGRLRLLRQMLAESTLVAGAAGVTGILFSLWTSDLVRAFQPPGDNPFAPNLTPDWRVLSFALILSLFAGIGFGLFPALQASRSHIVAALKGSGASHRSRWRAVMIGGQVALTTILLVSAGLLLHGFRKALTLDPGFGTERVLVVPFDLKLVGYDATRATAFYRELAESLKGTAEVRGASYAYIVPVGGRLMRMPIRRDASERESITSCNIVSPGYLGTMGLQLLAGRDFNAHDEASSPKVALVNETMAREMFGSPDASGKSFFIEKDRLQVVGVVKDSRYLRLGEVPRAHFYMPQEQNPEASMTLLVATSGSPVEALPAVRARVAAIDPRLAVLNARTLAEQVRQSLFDSRNGALIAALFGGVALLLAAVGLYGVIGHWVAGRTREIGVRMALGADPASVQRMVIREGMRRVVVGLILGAAGSFAAGQLLQKFLFGVSPADPVTWLAVAGLLGVVTVAATWIPSRRAAGVEPLTALRQD